MLTTPIAVPVVLISGEPDMPLTVSPSGSVQSLPRLRRRRRGRLGRARAGAPGRRFDGRKGRLRGDVNRRQRLDEGLVLLAFVAKRLVVGRAEHGDVGDRVREKAGGRYAGFRVEQADQEVVR